MVFTIHSTVLRTSLRFTIFSFFSVNQRNPWLLTVSLWGLGALCGLNNSANQCESVSKKDRVNPCLIEGDLKRQSQC